MINYAKEYKEALLDPAYQSASNDTKQELADFYTPKIKDQEWSEIINDERYHKLPEQDQLALQQDYGEDRVKRIKPDVNFFGAVSDLATGMNPKKVGLDVLGAGARLIDDPYTSGGLLDPFIKSREQSQQEFQEQPGSHQRILPFTDFNRGDFREGYGSAGPSLLSMGATIIPGAIRGSRGGVYGAIAGGLASIISGGVAGAEIDEHAFIGQYRNFLNNKAGRKLTDAEFAEYKTESFVEEAKKHKLAEGGIEGVSNAIQLGILSKIKGGNLATKAITGMAAFLGLELGGEAETAVLQGNVENRVGMGGRIRDPLNLEDVKEAAYEVAPSVLALGGMMGGPKVVYEGARNLLKPSEKAVVGAGDALSGANNVLEQARNTKQTGKPTQEKDPWQEQQDAATTYNKEKNVPQPEMSPEEVARTTAKNLQWQDQVLRTEGYFSGEEQQAADDLLGQIGDTAQTVQDQDEGRVERRRTINKAEQQARDTRENDLTEKMIRGEALTEDESLFRDELLKESKDKAKEAKQQALIVKQEAKKRKEFLATKGVDTDVLDQTDEEYQAWLDLKKGEAAPAPQPEFQPTKQAKELADEDPHRQAMEEAKKMGGISVEAAKQMFSPDTIKELSKVGLFTKNGQGIDDMATQLGYSSANELVDAWSNTGLKKDAVADLQQQEKDEFDRAEDAHRLAPVTEQSAEDMETLIEGVLSGRYSFSDKEIEEMNSLSSIQKSNLFKAKYSQTDMPDKSSNRILVVSGKDSDLNISTTLDSKFSNGTSVKPVGSLSTATPTDNKPSVSNDVNGSFIGNSKDLTNKKQRKSTGIKPNDTPRVNIGSVVNKSMLGSGHQNEIVDVVIGGIKINMMHNKTTGDLFPIKLLPNDSVKVVSSTVNGNSFILSNGKPVNKASLGAIEGTDSSELAKGQRKRVSTRSANTKNVRVNELIERVTLPITKVSSGNSTRLFEETPTTVETKNVHSVTSSDIMDKKGENVDAVPPTTKKIPESSVIGKPKQQPPVPKKQITTKSGQPFKSERSLKANAKRRGITDYVVKQVDGGYVGVVGTNEGGVKFSKGDDGQPRLSALHSLTEENLIFADEMGGMPVPSIAVVKDDMAMEGYGEITLIGGKSLGDPTTNPVFDADAYTATFPEPEYARPRGKRAELINDALRPYDKYGQSIWHQIEEYQRHANYGRVLETLLRSNIAKAKFLIEEKGAKSFRVPTRDKNLGIFSSFVRSDEVQNFFKDRKKRNKKLLSVPRKELDNFRKKNEEKYGKAVYTWPKEVSRGLHELDNKYQAVSERLELRKDEEALKELRDIVANVLTAEVNAKYGNNEEDIKSIIIDKRSKNIFDEDGNLHFSVYNNMSDNWWKRGQTEPDWIALSERLDKRLKGKESEFKSWAQEMVDDSFGEPFIKLSGRREIYSIENIAQKMINQTNAGAEKTLTQSAGKSRAQMAHRFKNLEKLRVKAKSDITDKKTVKEARKATEKIQEKYRDSVIKYGKYDTWTSLDDSMKALVSAANNGGNRRSLRLALSRLDFKNVPDYVLDEGLDAISAMVQAPVPYFESIPQRVVSLDEFSGAVIPNKTSKKTKEILKKHGIKYRIYGESRDEEARKAAVIKLRDMLSRQGQDTLFSKPTTHQAPKNPANIAKELRAAIGRGYDRLIRRGLLSVMDYDSAMKLLERVGGGKRSKGANKKKHELEKWAKNAIKKAFDKIDPAHDLGIRVHTDPTKFASDKSINEYQLFPPSVLNIGDDIKTNSYVWTEETPSDEERDGVSVIGIENNQKSIDRAIKLISNYHQNENEQIVIVEGFRTGSGFEEMEDIISDGIVVDIYTDNIEAKFSKETGQIEAFTYLDPATGKQKIVMIDGAIKKGEAYSTLLHEVGHTFLRDAFHGKQWDRLVKSFERHSKNDTPTGKAIRAAKLRVPKDTPGNVKAEEEIAYFLTSEAGQNLPLYKRIMGYIRRALVKMGMPASILQPSDIVEMAKGYLAQQAKATNKGSLLVGIREFAQPAMMSLSKATEKIKGMAAFKEWFGESVVTESGEAGGVPKVLYRGDFRINDVGDTFDIITGDEGGSGGIFFTDDPEIASSYAENKPYVPDEHYDSRNYISVDINGNTVPLNKVRGHLSVKDRQAIDNAVLTFGENEDTYEKEINSENTSIPEYIYNREKKAAHGNVIDAAYTTLIESAALYPSEEFVWFLEQTGVFDKVTYDDPYMSKSAVTPVYVSMQKPIDSNNISNETIKELETILGTDATLDSIKDQRFQTDPDAVVYVTDEFREAALSLGYDGIITRGGTITGGTAHTVYISLRPESVKSIFNRGTWSKTDPNIRHSYAGKKSLTVDESKLQEAIELRKSGEDADTIWQETGWKKAKDNKWRYEIDDSHMEFKTELLEGRIGALAKFIKHKELFEAYPQLKDIEISVKNLGKNNGQYIRGDDFNQARIEINPLNKQKNETLIHEIQHAIQDIEGFAKGGSADFELIKYKKKAKSFDKQVERFNDLLVKAVGTPEYSDIMDKKMSLVTDGLEEKLNDPIALMEKAHTDYKRLLGEVEARDAATRKDLTPKQRRLMPPYVTEGIAEEDMIVRTGDGVMFSVSDTTEKLKEKVGKLFTDDLISAAEIQPQKTDIKVFEPWVSTPEYTLKKAPATARMLDAGLKKSELKTKNEDYILDGIDNNTGAAEYIAKHQSFAKSMTELEKKNPAEYKEANDYLLKVDRTGKAFRLKFKDNVYSVLDKEGKKLKDFDNSPDAVSFLMAAEAKHLLDNGMSGKAIDAVINSRVVLNRGFDVMARDYQKIIDSAAAMGMPEPSVKVEGEDGKTKTITLSEAIAMMGDLRGSYFPRQRERGGVVLKAIKGDKQIRKHFDLYITPGGKKIDFDTGMEIPANKLMEIARKGFNRMTPLGREMMKLQKQGYDMSVEKNVSMPESVFEATQLMTSINAIMEEGLSQAKTNEKLADAYSVLNNILTHSVADIFKARGGLSSRMKRTKSYWEGFETDMKIAVVMYAKGMAATSAKRETAQAITEALTGRDISFDKFKADGLGETYEEFLEFVKDRRLDPKQTPNLYKEAMSWTKEILRNDEQIDRIIGTMKGLAVLKFLGFRVSSAVVNMTNLAQAVPATMASHLDIPINKAMRQVTASLKVLHDYSKGNGSTLDKKIITDLKERGWDNPQFNHENAAVLRSKVGNRYSKFVDLSMAMFGKAEQINRGATIHAAYIQAKRQFPGLKHDALMKKAKSVSDRAHGVYGKETAPVWTRGSGNILRAGYTFKKFSHNYMLNMAEMIGRGKNKEAAYMLLSPAILAGGSASLATPVISGIISALGGGDDPTEEFYQWAEDNLGTDRIFRHGLAGAFGTNLTGSLQLNAPFPTTKDDIFGAPGSVIGDIGKGIKHATKGEGFKAAERLLPAGIGNVFKSIREYNEGATTNSYGPVFYGDEPLKATAADAFLRAISFNPSGLSGKREKQWSEKKIAMKYQDKRSAINSRIKKMLVQNDGRIDRGEWGSILGAIKKYNDIVRGLGRKDIRPIDARKALKRMVRNVNRAPRSERGRVM